MKKIIFFVFVIALTTGCSQREKVEMPTEYTETSSDSDAQGNNTNTISGTSLADTLGVADRWDGEYMGNDDMTGIDINCGVEFPNDIAGIDTYKAESILLTEEYKKNFIDKFSEETIYAADDEARPKEYWEEKINEAEQKLGEYEEKMVEDPTLFYSTEDIQDEILKMKEYYANAPLEYEAAENYSGNTYIITYDDVDYEISFTEDDEGYVTCISLAPVNAGELYSAEQDEKYVISAEDLDRDNNYMTGIYRYTSEDNKYKRETEELYSEVDSFISGLGLTDFSAARTYNISVEKINEEMGRYDKETDGCMVVLLKQFDGVYMSGEEYETYDAEMQVFDENMEFETVTYQAQREKLEQINLYINDTGVIKMTYQFPLQWSPDTENTTLISFDSVKSVCIENAEKLDAVHPVFTKLDFIYCICNLSGSNHEFAVIPAWRLHNDSNNGVTYDYNVLVNAIDGSSISEFR